VLRSAAQEIGLDPDEMQHQVEKGTYTAAVEEQVAAAQEMGITGVPTYILDDKYAIVGAQPYEVFERALARLAAEAQGRDDET
jgi:predicted DsbA family dithiol-disulfide isomerase